MATVILDELLSDCVTIGSGTLVLKPDQPPRFRAERGTLPLRQSPLDADDVRQLVVDGLSAGQREELQSRRYVTFDHSVLLTNGTFARFRAVVGLTSVGLLAVFCRTDAAPAQDPTRWQAIDAPGLAARPRLQLDAAPAPRGEPPFDDEAGSPPSPAVVLPLSPVLAGAAAKLPPRGSQIDDNLFAW